MNIETDRVLEINLEDIEKRYKKTESLYNIAQEQDIQKIARPALITFPFDIIHANIRFASVNHKQTTIDDFTTQCDKNNVIPYYTVNREYDSRSNLFTTTSKLPYAKSSKTIVQIEKEIERAQADGKTPNTVNYIVKSDDEYNWFSYHILTLPYSPMEKYEIEEAYLYFKADYKQSNPLLMKLERNRIGVTGIEQENYAQVETWVSGLTKFEQFHP